MGEKSLRELELEHYWRAMQEGTKVFPSDDYKGELEMLATMTEWPRLKAVAGRDSTRFDFNRRRASIVR